MENKYLLQRIRHWLVLPERLLLLRWSGWFFIFTALIAVVVGIRYLLSYPLPGEAIALFYTFSAYISHLASFCFVAWIVFVIPLVVLIPLRKFILPLCILISSFIITLLLLDTLVYAENRFHIGLLTLTILGWKTWGFGIFYFVVLLLFTSLLAKWILDKFLKKSRIWLGITVAAVEIVLLLSTHVIHIFADAKYYTPITRFTTVLPLFYPTTARRYLEKKGYIDIEKNRSRNLVRTMEHIEGTLSYPLKPLVFERPDTAKNIVIILIDALRDDMVNAHTTPRLDSLSRSSLVYTNHFSGGNSTRMGVFSLFYGLPSTYWQFFEGTRQTPVLIDKLQELRYDIGIFSSGQLNRPTSLDRTAFANIDNLRIRTLSKNQAPYARDSAITVDWINWLHSRKSNTPFFGFLFYDAPCAKDFPPAYNTMRKRFTGSDKNALLASYKTAVYYTDSLVNVVYKDLRDGGFLNTTVVFITADHGEEFDDNGLGYTGHGSSYSLYQLKVPLIIHWPGKEPGSIAKRTSHNDIPATILTEVFGCVNPASDYCSGSTLFSDREWTWLIAGSYYNFAILEKNQVTVNYPGGYFEIRDSTYTVISNKNLNKDILTDALNETKRFFKN